ncbi:MULTISPECIES: DUF4376 domain-containing protein [Rodentibacter]|uniref:DUF4376 domain-containing protein n=1 Tax=Rodentibacter TaxID=1960084 RepID=UPI001CFE16DD|nr:DUF4376 domain-containing protein [Rodentibacter sp. JRC1]GJI55896.1 hypothetical protein HEMROJRC1_10080 [Rodentibacter sp. JRC1]
MTVQFDNEGFAIADGEIVIYLTDHQGVYSHQEIQFIATGTGLSANAYLDTPPKAKTGFAIVRTAKGWEYIADHRGKTYYDKSTQRETVMTELGEIPSNLTALKPKNEHEAWNENAERWEISAEKQTALLNEQREKIRIEINALRDKKNCNGVYVSALGKWFDNDDAAYQNLLGFKASLDLLGDYETAWICADNSVIPDFNKEKLTQVIAQIMQDKTANVQNAMRHKIALEQSRNPSEYNFSDGWTQTYVDFMEQSNE